VGAAAAVVFLVVAALFDTMSYPQVPYIFLCFAALVAAIVTAPGADYSGDD
jgi:peptidoglycan/LPS O-acetylase OafA/YrhL